MASTHQPVTDVLRTTLDLFATGIELMRQNLRRSHPEATEEDLDHRLHQWLQDRPGAEFGDCVGRPVNLSSRIG